MRLTEIGIHPVKEFCETMSLAPEGQANESARTSFKEISELGDIQLMKDALVKLRDKVVYEASVSDFVVSSISVALTIPNEQPYNI